MPLRAFLLFGRKGDKHQPLVVLWVSMPLRAFLLFGRGKCVRLSPWHGKRFQCPCGHFCFSDSTVFSLGAASLWSFNALAGIFAFRTQRCAARRPPPRCAVSMPLRAFLLFGQDAAGVPSCRVQMRFNALAGIFAFRTRWRRGAGG